MVYIIIWWWYCTWYPQPQNSGTVQQSILKTTPSVNTQNTTYISLTTQYIITILSQTDRSDIHSIIHIHSWNKN
jgi:hypothetical protein